MSDLAETWNKIRIHQDLPPTKVHAAFADWIVRVGADEVYAAIGEENEWNPDVAIGMAVEFSILAGLLFQHAQGAERLTTPEADDDRPT